MQRIDQSVLDAAMSYEDYMALIEKLLEEGKTTGPNQSESLTNYARLNHQRMTRIHKQTTLSEDLLQTIAAAKHRIWLVITEGWCGDAANSVPVMDLVAQAGSAVTLKLILRDEHPEVMDQFLTNGGKSIPIVVVLDAETREVITRWGPRPAPAQQLILDHKENPVEGRDIYRDLQLWYNQDKGATLQAEFAQLLNA